ncbi:MAG: M20/M25/M40 family metallo-hydrolase [Planctomycetes bacterium]|nr:M20/M25/M40 family metallo-hydrolase [Planctomycetota bacterium]
MHRQTIRRAWAWAIVLVTAVSGPIQAVRGQAEADGAGSIADRYRPAAKRIIDAALAGNDAYNKLEQLCDGIGNRLSGSPQLKRAVRWAAAAMTADGQENVRLESVMVQHWVRGTELLMMNEPREAFMPMLGLGGSVATPPEGITADVVSVADEKALDALGEAVRGKIVLFNYPMPPFDPETGSGYGAAVRYRGGGAQMAAKYGAVACLVRSCTAKSFQSPHTGGMKYGDAETKIPTAAITIEDAARITRLQARGVSVNVTLKMEAKMLAPAPSANVIGELRGTTYPDEIVVIGGHIDSWDVGQGAHDDGGGCVTAMEAINVLRRLNMIPQRTIRVVLWTNEENGLAGGKQYAIDHADELSNHVAAIESDGGSFAPIGYSIACNDEARQATAVKQMGEILSLLAPLGATKVETGHSGADVGPLKGQGVITMSHMVDMSTYFDYHHTHADTLDKVDPEELSQNVAVMATVAYILADMPGRLGEDPAGQ